MSKDGPVAVPEVQPPQLDISVRGASHNEAAIGADVHAQHRQLVTVQGQEELQTHGQLRYDNWGLAKE